MKTTRPPEPQFLIQWRNEWQDWMRAGTPKLCHTCEHYGIDGLCTEYFLKPPADFAATPDACDKWMQEIPF